MCDIMYVKLKDIGYKCKQFRIKQGYYQHHVARDTGYTIENVSAFECGRNDNSRILLWYLSKGMSANELIGR